jgi:hypothetical protein
MATDLLSIFPSHIFDKAENLSFVSNKIELGGAGEPKLLIFNNNLEIGYIFKWNILRRYTFVRTNANDYPNVLKQFKEIG